MGVREWVAKVGKFFFSQQSNSGERAIQVGEVRGNLTIIQTTKPAPFGGLPDDAQAAQRLREEQLRVLRMLNAVIYRKGVTDFMRREFGTSLVKELGFPQLFRVRRYLQAVLDHQADKRAQSKTEAQGNGFARSETETLKNFVVANSEKQSKGDEP